MKSIGIVKVNLVEFADAANGPSKNGQRQKLPLEKCPDKNANVEFTIRSVLVSSDATGTETISLASGAMSVDSGPESCFDFQDLESGKANNLGRKRTNVAAAAAGGPDGNILIQIQGAQSRERPQTGPNNEEESKGPGTASTMIRPQKTTNFLNRVCTTTGATNPEGASVEGL